MLLLGICLRVSIHISLYEQMFLYYQDIQKFQTLYLILLNRLILNSLYSLQIKLK